MIKKNLFIPLLLVLAPQALWAGGSCYGVSSEAEVNLRYGNNYEFDRSGSKSLVTGEFIDHTSQVKYEITGEIRDSRPVSAESDSMNQDNPKIYRAFYMGADFSENDSSTSLRGVNPTLMLEMRQSPQVGRFIVDLGQGPVEIPVECQ